jgi:hypothetical protein
MPSEIAIVTPAGTDASAARNNAVLLEVRWSDPEIARMFTPDRSGV